MTKRRTMKRMKRMINLKKGITQLPVKTGSKDNAHLLVYIFSMKLLDAGAIALFCSFADPLMPINIYATC